MHKSHSPVLTDEAVKARELKEPADRNCLNVKR